jgi:CysZ protein
MQNNSLSGINYFIKGFSLIFKPGIRQWVLIPLLINIFLFNLLIYLGWLQFQTVIEIVMPQLQSWLPAWLIEALRWLILPLFIVIALIVVFFTFTFLANLIGAPFNGLLAAAVEKHLMGKAVESPSEPWYKLMIWIIWSPIEKLLYYLRWAIVLLIVSLIPVINIVSPILWFLFGAWMFSLEYANAHGENHGYKAPAIRKILAKKRLLVLGFGSSVFVAMLIPVVNFLVMPVAVAGATCMWVYEFSLRINSESNSLASE